MLDVGSASVFGWREDVGLQVEPLTALGKLLHGPYLVRTCTPRRIAGEWHTYIMDHGIQSRCLKTVTLKCMQEIGETRRDEEPKIQVCGWRSNNVSSTYVGRYLGR
jgi:hypothetical protein